MERCDEEGTNLLGFDDRVDPSPFSRHIGVGELLPILLYLFYPHHLRVLGLFDLILKNNLGSRPQVP